MNKSKHLSSSDLITFSACFHPPRFLLGTKAFLLCISMKKATSCFVFFCPVPPKEHLKPFKSNLVTVSTEHYRHSGNFLLGAGLPSSVGGKGRMKTMKRTRRAQIFGPAELPTDAFNEQRCWGAFRVQAYPCVPIRRCPF